MPNSNTKHSKALRISFASKWNNENRKKGLIKQVNITFCKPESIEKLNNLKITKVNFFEKALEILNEYGEIK